MPRVSGTPPGAPLESAPPGAGGFLPVNPLVTHNPGLALFLPRVLNGMG